MTKEIALFINPINNKELLTDPDNLESILTEIISLENLVFDLSTDKGVEEIKSLKSDAAKWVKELKAFCEPLEADGKRISDARSVITTKLLTGKESVINKVLEPIVTIEKKLKALNIQIVTPINDLHSCDIRLQEIEELKAYNWLAFKEEADKLILQQITVVTATRDRIEKEAKDEQDKQDKKRREREAFIAMNAAENAKREIEEKIEREKEDRELEEHKKKAKEQEKINVEEFGRENKERKRGINLEATSHLEELIKKCEDYCGLGQYEFKAKEIIKAIVKGDIPHLTIKY